MLQPTIIKALHLLLLVVVQSLYFVIVLMDVRRMLIDLVTRIMMLIHHRDVTFRYLVINTTEVILLHRLLMKEIDEDPSILLHHNHVLILWPGIRHNHKIPYMSDAMRDILLETKHLHTVMMIE